RLAHDQAVGQGRRRELRPRAGERRRMNAHALARVLDDRIEGEVRFADGDRGLYADDASNYRFPPLGVVIPRTADDVVATIAACREFGVPVTSRGGGTGLAGQTVNAAVVLDFSKYQRDVIE